MRLIEGEPRKPATNPVRGLLEQIERSPLHRHCRAIDVISQRSTDTAPSRLRRSRPRRWAERRGSEGARLRTRTALTGRVEGFACMGRTRIGLLLQVRRAARAAMYCRTRTLSSRACYECALSHKSVTDVCVRRSRRSAARNFSTRMFAGLTVGKLIKRRAKPHCPHI